METCSGSEVTGLERRESSGTVEEILEHPTNERLGQQSSQRQNGISRGERTGRWERSYLSMLALQQRNHTWYPHPPRQCR